jgi:hypothetical protein
MGQFGVISARTCGSCYIDTTAWWQISVNNKKPEELSEKHKATIKRIQGETK